MSLPPFQTVVDVHGATVLRVCRALLGPVDAQDAWSETFLSALTAYPALPADANVQAWLVTIAHRKAVDALRARSRAPVPLAHLPDRPPPPVPTPDDDLWAAVAALPDRQRQAVAYHHVLGLPFREVAELTGGTVAAARRASADGIAALRRSRIRSSSTLQETP
ncbi:sigma-70 family RNA polymerase sigma factor [Nakamurella flavida]|uniref:Sigma-70 family RNA polymerase sigma factor n=1 Tax=Nakamurella flavida TaxID=363630 RepID=A0A938YR85_9ACTN|nr:sigma-70 family RNA polymerase sigma factor [Nakamurella flavida]MBM9477758.1 sigma-70 family RNA polymerase sigma factor [Nakamurella flavida]MDP9779310.1 RNA polymerase sigma factor (sigma-70 family) [Nakamurella flavida]